MERKQKCEVKVAKPLAELTMESQGKVAALLW